jgi:hypothetical protein
MHVLLSFLIFRAAARKKFLVERTDIFLEGNITVLPLAMEYSRERRSLTSPMLVITRVIDERRWVIAQSPTRER